MSAAATAGARTASEPAPSPALAPPPGHPRFALFDSLRGIAALLIITFHVASITGALDRPVVGEVVSVLGPRSLTLFFVISGFLLYRPFVAARAAGRSRPSIPRYARRRVLRIVPAFWVALTALAIFPGIVGVFSPSWWRFYFFLQLYSHQTVGQGIPVAWSLCVEVTFYLALPAWALGVARLRIGSGRRAWLWGELAPLALVAAAGVAVQVATAQQQLSELVGASLLGQCTWLALGMALAVASVAVERREDEPRVVRLVAAHPGLCWLVAGAALALLAGFLQPRGLVAIVQALSTQQPIPKTLAAIALSGVLCGAFVLPAVFGERAGGLPRRLLASAPIAWLGLISYGLFLWHLTLAQLIALPADPAHFSASGLGLADEIGFATTPILLALTVAAAAAVAALSYYLVELPFLRLKER